MSLKETAIPFISDQGEVNYDSPVLQSSYFISCLEHACTAVSSDKSLFHRLLILSK